MRYFKFDKIDFELNITVVLAHTNILVWNEVFQR